MTEEINVKIILYIKRMPIPVIDGNMSFWNP
jgi:hypothetical protein